ncbi:MAG: hypothetical protein JO156_08535, partial [Solirubrobacterales bacterium]|nr:hypothetical protein [Solirubrobacterales bacterium]
EDFPPELRDSAGTLGLDQQAIEPTLGRVLESLELWLAAEPPAVLAAARERDALRGKQVRWSGGQGCAVGIDQHGRLLVDTGTERVALGAGEVHLEP